MTYVLWMQRKSSDTLTLNILVMVADSCKQQHKHWDQHHDDPGSFQKLRRGHDQGDQSRGYRSHSNDQQTAQPVAVGCAEVAPVYDHARLRERKGDEDANGEQVNERVRDAPKDDA